MATPPRGGDPAAGRRPRHIEATPPRGSDAPSFHSRVFARYPRPSWDELDLSREPTVILSDYTGRMGTVSPGPGLPVFALLVCGCLRRRPCHHGEDPFCPGPSVTEPSSSTASLCAVAEEGQARGPRGDFPCLRKERPAPSPLRLRLAEVSMLSLSHCQGTWSLPGGQT